MYNLIFVESEVVKIHGKEYCKQGAWKINNFLPDLILYALEYKKVRLFAFVIIFFVVGMSQKARDVYGKEKDGQFEDLICVKKRVFLKKSVLY